MNTNNEVNIEKQMEASKTDAGAMVEMAKEYAGAIKDEKSCAEAAEFMLVIKKRMKFWKEFFDPIVEKSREAWKLTVAKRDLVLESFEKPEKEILKPAITKYYLEQEEKRKAEEARILEEQKRQARENAKKAMELEKEGKFKQADALFNKPVVVVPPPPPVQMAAGISMQTVWKFEIVDPKLIPAEYMIPDEVKIGGVARSMKGQIQIPGVRIYSEQTVKGRAG